MLTKAEDASLTVYTLRASLNDLNCTEHTDKTSGINRLNSSKQVQDPEAANPLNTFPRDLKSISGEQLKT